MGTILGLPTERRQEIWGVLVLSLTSLLFLALSTDGYQGENHRSLSDIAAAPNALGQPGAVVAGFLYILLGFAAHVLYFLTCVWGMMLIRHKPIDRLSTRLLGFVMLTGFIAAMLHMNFSGPKGEGLPGGAVGQFVTHLIQPTFGTMGANVIALALSLVGLLLSTEFLIVKALHWCWATVVLAIHTMQEIGSRWSAARHERLAVLGASELMAVPASVEKLKKTPLLRSPKKKPDLSRIKVRSADVAEPVEQELPFDEVPGYEDESSETNAASAKAKSKSDDTDSGLDADSKSAGSSKSTSGKRGTLRRKRPGADSPYDYRYPAVYTKPSVSMLEQATVSDHSDVTDSLRETGVQLEETLQTFGVDAKVTDVTRGPTITRYEVEPAPGVKVSRFMALADDIALALKAHRVRVEAPIPGKGRVGIEVPNDVRESVVIRELLESRKYRSEEKKGQLTLVMGKDITGNPVTVDLASMPHLLVAGATGAGKTVYVKNILASLLFSKTPDELQIMLIDPKMVELSIFNDIPHLITPVVIDPKKAATALNWLINEMEERYRLFADLGVRNIDVYNESVQNGEIEVTEGSADGSPQSVSAIRKLPYIVCIIDELADLMMMARAEVEDAIARLAQLARAVGIHLVIATQRPSVDVLTGVIKANFPARVSFQVSSRVDSRCILDEIGAERLIGRGDMLYLPAGQSKPLRIQGAFVSDEEMNALITHLKKQAPPQYRDEIENFGKQQSAVDDLLNETDELFDDAVQVVVETGQASISMVQRRLRVGYTRAARLIDMMEVKGIVGPHVGSKAREILVSVPQTRGEVV